MFFRLQLKYDCFQQLDFLTKTQKTNENFADNNIYNILRIFDG